MTIKHEKRNEKRKSNVTRSLNLKFENKRKKNQYFSLRNNQ